MTALTDVPERPPNGYANVRQAALAYALKPENCTGGNLHIVLEDGNTGAGSIAFCIVWAAIDGDEDGCALAMGMVTLSEDECDRIVEDVHTLWRERGIWR